jgi:hypothetical protein
VSIGYNLSTLQPFDIAMVGLYFVLDQQNFVTFKNGVNTLLLALNLPMEGLRDSKELEEKK